MNSTLISITSQLEAVEENGCFIAIDDDADVLKYYESMFQLEDRGSNSVLTELEALLDRPLEDPGGDTSDLDSLSLNLASSGEEAIEFARQALSEHSPITVALVDMRMPGGMDGLQTARELRQIDPRVKIVFVTAYSDYAIDEIHKQLAYDVFYLNKPLGRDEVVQMVRTLNRGWKDREKSKLLEMQMRNQAKMASLGNMAVRIGHEINQPLAYIKGMLQLQKMEFESGAEVSVEELLKEIDLALMQTVRIKEIIDSLRIFAHPDRRNRGEIVLSEAVDHVRRICSAPMDTEHIRFEVSIPDGLPPLYGNSSMFQQILTNLLSNSVDALTEYEAAGKMSAPPTIRLAASHLQPLNRVELIFEDNGPGIPEELRGRIFDPFVTTKEPGSGTGLGLSEVNGILKEHGATIEYRPRQDLNGARFVIHFPTIDETEDDE